MSRRTAQKVLVTMALLVGTLAAWAGSAFLESRYGTHTAPLTTSVTFEITNGTDRVILSSVMVRADAASNTWTLLIVNNNFTNILKTATLTASSHTLLYEGMGTVPWGGNARLRVTGTVNTNAALTTNLVQWSVHTQPAR